MNKTKIEYCHYTWNPVTGCLHICGYCYARKITRRFSGIGYPRCGEDVWGFDLVELDEPYIWCDENNAKHRIAYPADFAPTFHKYKLNEPSQVKTPSIILVCSMADLFGRWLPDAWIDAVFDACAAAPHHKYLFLTKNPKRYIELHKTGKLPQKHYYGWTVTDKSNTHRNILIEKGYNTFVSFEPLLDDPCYFDNAQAKLTSWAIIGSMTGPLRAKYTPRREWIEKIVQHCQYAEIPVFMKNNTADVWGEPLLQQTPFG